MNYSIKIDLLKLQGAFIREMKGTTATKKCIIIPVDDNACIYHGAKGCYLNTTAIELREPKYNDTHCIKPDLPREQRERMTDDERRNVPILGGLHALQTQQQPTQQQTANDVFNATDDDDMPF